MNDFQTLLQTMIQRWRQESVPIQNGVDAIAIKEFESKFNVVLPGDMKEFFLTVNGMGNEYDEEGFYRFWPLDEVEPIKTHTPEFMKAYPESMGYFFFFDHSIDLFMYAIRLGDSERSLTPVAQVYPQADSLSFEQVFASFTEFVSTYVHDPNRLL